LRDSEWLVTAIAVLIGLYVLWYAFTLDLTRKEYSIIFLGASLALYYSHQIVEGNDADAFPGESLGAKISPCSPRINGWIKALLNLSLAIIAIVLTFYMVYHIDRLRYVAPGAGFEQLDYLFGLLAIVLVTDVTYRVYGRTLAGVIVVTFLYGIGGPYLPGIFHHTGMSMEAIVESGAIGMSGVYGFLIDIGATLVAIFIIFAGLARAYGAMDRIIAIGREMRHLTSTGVVHTAVISSMMMGSITGSAAANTATTGSFTIPLMQDQGIRDEFAAAIESIASSAGQMLPPVMGVAAFLMADILGISYLSVIQAGTIPALLFYVSLAFTIDLTVRYYGWTVSSQGSFDYSTLANAAHFVVPLSVLVYALAVMRTTALTAGFYACIVLIATMIVYDLYEQRSVRAPFGTVKKGIEGLKQGALDMAPLIAIICSLGFSISIITATGLSQRLSTQMIALAGGIFIFVLVLAMITSILFGMGMPTPAAYIIVAILIAPVMTEFGIAEITAHMFVFYFAMLSAITPPVAVAVVVASRIAGSDFLISSYHTVRMALPVFIVPFVFVIHPELLLWAFPETIVAIALVLPGLLAISMVSVGHNVVGDLNVVGRGFYLVIALVILFYPGMFVRLIALGLIALSIVPAVNLKISEFTTEVNRRWSS
jgi:TRAP transporter 4TM/12TM fusion protein